MGIDYKQIIRDEITRIETKNNYLMDKLKNSDSMGQKYLYDREINVNNFNLICLYELLSKIEKREREYEEDEK